LLKDSTITEETLVYVSENQVSNSSTDCTDSTANLIGSALGNFYDELAYRGADFYNEKTQIFNLKKVNWTTLDEYISGTINIYEADPTIIQNYYNVSLNNLQYLADGNNEIAIANGIFCYASQNSNNKWLFSTLANILDVPCEYQVMANVADTAVLGAATVMGGGPVTAIGAASSYANMINNGIECFA